MLVLIEWTDLVFAVDSIPAIFAVTSDPFIVFTSNIFAILGLRSLFFLLAGRDREVPSPEAARSRSCSLFVGAKMLLLDVYKIPIGASLGVVAATDRARRGRIAADSGEAARGAGRRELRRPPR